MWKLSEKCDWNSRITQISEVGRLVPIRIIPKSPGPSADVVACRFSVLSLGQSSHAWLTVSVNLDRRMAMHPMHLTALYEQLGFRC